MRHHTLLSNLAVLYAGMAVAQAPEVTMCATVCPDGHRVTFVCSQGAPCNYSSAPSSTSSTSNSSIDYANFGFQLGQKMGEAIVKSMRESEQRAAAKRAEAEEAARQEKERAEAEARRQAEERERKQEEMYKRLSQSLRRVGSVGDADIHRSDTESGLRIRRSTDYSELPALEYVDFSSDEKPGSSGSSVEPKRPD